MCSDVDDKAEYSADCISPPVALHCLNVITKCGVIYDSPFVDLIVDDRDSQLIVKINFLSASSGSAINNTKKW